MSIISGGKILAGGNVVKDAGTNTPLPLTAVPVDGASGSYAGIAPVGALAKNFTTGITYENQAPGTQAAPTWVQVST